MKPSRELRNLILGYVHDASEGDVSYRDIVSESPDAVAFGSDVKEIWIGGERIRAIGRAQAVALGRFTFSVDHLRAFEDGPFGWGGIAFGMTRADGMTVPYRISFAFHREDEEWKVIQLHTSVCTDNSIVMGEQVGVSFDAMVELVESEQPDLSTAASPEGTVTIMFTDIESSTSTNERLGDDRWVALLRQHNQIVRASVASHGGTVLKSQGDGFMLVFPSARRAVESGIDVQRALAELGSSDEPLLVRMGLHTGEPVSDARDFFGRDVAYAARVASAATGGQLLVSSLTKALVDASGAFRFDGPHEYALKGFDGPQQLFSAIWR